jgi:hypothetical protein
LLLWLLLLLLSELPDEQIHIPAVSSFIAASFLCFFLQILRDRLNNQQKQKEEES